MRSSGYVLAGFALLYAAGAHAQAWRERTCLYRRPVDVVSGYQCDAATFSFYHAGRLRSDAADVRMYDGEGNNLPHVILQNGPDDFVRLAFRHDGKDGRCYVYYGDASSRPAVHGWKPKGGLVMETRRYRGGDPGSLAGMRDIIKRSGPSFGRAFVKNVFHGLNVFGPHTNYVSIYSGTLYAPSTGKYVFCTSSDDASFLLVDGQLVVSWPGWHGAVADTRHNASLNLSAGPHDFEYLHVNGGGAGVAVAAWQHPGAARIMPIPPEAFGWPGSGKIGPVEVRGGGGAADFQCETTAEAPFGEDAFIVKIAFTDTGGQDTGTEWDFGDGTSGRGRFTEHVYLVEGDFTVRMKNRYGECANRVAVSHRWWNDASRQTSLKDLAPVLRSYDFARLRSACLKRALDIFREIEDAEGAHAVMQAVVKRAGEVDADTVAECAVTLARSMSVHAPQDALKMLASLEKTLADNPAAVARLLLAEGDVLFYFLDDADRALELYDRIVSRFAGKVQEHTVRIAKIRMGDVHRGRGDYEKALRSYLDAEKLKLHPWPADRLAVRKGALFMEVESHIRSGDFDAAAESLDTLEWEYPAERLRGESSLLRGRIALGKKNLPEACKQFLALVGVNPSSEYAAECLYLCALAKEQLGLKEEAEALKRRIAGEYPESPRAARTGK